MQRERYRDEDINLSGLSEEDAAWAVEALLGYRLEKESMTNILELPKLYKKTSTGAIQTWKIATEGNEITTVYGLDLGKKQVAREVITTGKNIGKANETTPEQQAQAEAQSQWEKKLKKGYVQNKADAQDDKVDTNAITGGVDPMLAKSYDKDSKKVSYPAYVQPKLDGHRCIAICKDGTVTLWSRTRKRINSMPHIVKWLEENVANHGGDIILDGELYNHDYKDRFEELTSKIRQSSPQPGHEIVQYWVYDIVTDDPFSTRVKEVEMINELTPSGPVVGLATFEVTDEADMIQKFGVFIDQGYEGLMVRNTAGVYKGKRSSDLQKVKMMQDAEYEIVDVVSGRGKMEGLAIFRCVTEDGREFGAKMKGALDDLRKYLDNKDDYIGKQLTVQFQKFSAEGTPIFPVGLRIREDV